MVMSESPVKHETKINFDDLKSVLQACYQCSSCASICPVRKVSKFNPRKIIQKYILDSQVTEDDLTSCLMRSGPALLAMPSVDRMSLRRLHAASLP